VQRIEDAVGSKGGAAAGKARELLVIRVEYEFDIAEG
jgi:hypothetical protein